MMSEHYINVLNCFKGRTLFGVSYLKPHLNLVLMYLIVFDLVYCHIQFKLLSYSVQTTAVTCLLSSQSPFRSVTRTLVEFFVKFILRMKSTGESHDVTSAQVLLPKSAKTAKSPNTRNPVATKEAAGIPGIQLYCLFDF